MSASAFFEVTEAFRRRIGELIGGENLVHVGPPLSAETNEVSVSLFLFHLEVNAELRNTPHHATPRAPATGPAPVVPALPWDLLYLITVFRLPDHNVRPPNELSTLGAVVQGLHVDPVLPASADQDRPVRVSPAPYSMEDVSRLWGLFPQDVYRTSLVYLATPVFVEGDALASAAPVTESQRRGGLFDPREVG